MKNKRYGIIAAVVLVLFSGIFMAANRRDAIIAKNMDLFFTLFQELNLYYVDETDPEKLIQSGIDGMLKELDPYTTYIAEEDMADFKFMTTGQYGGIGALIRKAGDYTIISEPYEGFPAYKAGLQAGDTIISIDGVCIKNKTVSAVSDMLKGTPNTSFQLKLRRYGIADTLKKEVTREKITIDNVPYYGILHNNIGYIGLSNFTQNAGDEVRNALIQLKEQGAESVILDLRSNPGGLLMEAVEVANVFLPKNQKIVYTRGKIKDFDKEYYTRNQPVDTIIPLTVLVDRGSASASEIVAGAIQDLDRGVIIGKRTFGKGLVQTTRPVSHNSRLKITSAKYYIPSGRCIQAIDYSHRNDDGSVGYVPDSLISQFSTRNGRIVYDGGGISPDINFERDKPSEILIALVQKNMIFNYATIYFNQHDSIGNPLAFQLSEKEYNSFIDYVKNSSFTYNTASNKQFDELVNEAKKEKYYTHAKSEFDALKKMLASNPEKDMVVFKDEIKELMVDEIVSRYYYQRGRIKAGLKYDEEVNRAIDILEDSLLYKAKLKPGTEIIANNGRLGK